MLASAKGRDLAAWLGLTPRQHSTGGKTKLLGISKRGNRYLRTQLIHGARAAMTHFATKPTPTGAWVRGLLARAHPNVVVVALAAKLARIAGGAAPGPQLRQSGLPASRYAGLISDSVRRNAKVAHEVCGGE